MKQPGTPNLSNAIVSKQKAESAAVAAADLFDKLELSQAETELALLTLITLQVTRYVPDYPAFLYSLDLYHKTAKAYAELARPGIEAAIERARAARD